MIFKIKSWLTGGVLFSIETDTLKLAVETAVKSRADLSGADLYGADLSGADLSRTNLCGYISVGPIGSRKSYLCARWEDKKYIVHTGCFSDTLEKFKEAVERTHKDGVHRDEYLLLIKLLECRMEESKK